MRLTSINEIIRKMNTFKTSRFPCFFISGVSIPDLESFSINLANSIENGCHMRFKGIVKHFTIKMPFFYAKEQEYEFVEHLKESISIAKDCYDSYCGLILIEIDKEWCVRGLNSNFNCLTSFIGNNPQICFVVHAVQDEMTRFTDDIYMQLSTATQWIRLHRNGPDIEYCINYFRSMAADLGYSLSDETITILPELLEKTDFTNYDACHLVKQILLQIRLDRYMNSNNGRIIQVDDIQHYFILKHRGEYAI